MGTSDGFIPLLTLTNLISKLEALLNPSKRPSETKISCVILQVPQPQCSPDNFKYFIQNKKRLPLSLENKNLMVVSKTMSTCLD